MARSDSEAKREKLTPAPRATRRAATWRGKLVERTASSIRAYARLLPTLSPFMIFSSKLGLILANLYSGRFISLLSTVKSERAHLRLSCREVRQSLGLKNPPRSAGLLSHFHL